MTELLDIHTIVHFLVEQGVVKRTVTINNRLKGTTDDRVFTLAENEEPEYVLKIDHPQSISYVEQLHQAYLSSPLLPKLIYIDPDKQYIVYTYIAGVTHVNRGAKVAWLTRLVRDLLNHYEKHERTKQWGRLETPRESWQCFLFLSDDLNRSTLFAAFDMLNRTTIDRSRLIQEVTFQLYCRIGICSRVHPQDLNDYLNAWDHWKREVRLHEV